MSLHTWTFEIGTKFSIENALIVNFKLALDQIVLICIVMSSNKMNDKYLMIVDFISFIPLKCVNIMHFP